MSIDTTIFRVKKIIVDSAKQLQNERVSFTRKIIVETLDGLKFELDLFSDFENNLRVEQK